MSLSFSDDSKSLISVGAEDEHIVCIWRSLDEGWNEPVLQAWATSGTDRILFSSFTSPHSSTFSLVTGGINCIKFWTLQQTDLIATKGVFGSVGKVQSMLCGVGIGERFVTGSPSGHLYLWLKNKLE